MCDEYLNIKDDHWDDEQIESYIVEQFMTFLHENIEFWSRQTGTPKENQQGMVFSILTALDGCSGSFAFAIEDLAKINTCMLHDQFYKNRRLVTPTGENSL